MGVTAIRDDADLQAALARIEELMMAEVGTQEGEELDKLVDLVQAYEDACHEPDVRGKV